ncbi:response regulator [Thalassobaculum fulvum]|uniref:Response regulator n=1 Tax=Thalassobaculum fulvum TaxID=1633335 RepID=A0A919CSV3_9PROT|nr:response regulator [Thalassobaculum fulvum]GHD63959.1 response regulator [Thalassobaculum fulvum]
MPEKIDFSKVSFLIVDKSPPTARLIRDILHVLGVTAIRIADTVERARKMLRRDPVDVIITEHHLGEESGLALIEWVRTAPDSLDRMTPIIMLTANSEEDYVVRARDIGVTEFLAKPFNVEGLYRRLVAVIARPRAFVNADGYFGPDRRRRQVPYTGPDRRRSDD